MHVVHVQVYDFSYPETKVHVDRISNSILESVLVVLTDNQSCIIMLLLTVLLE